MIKTRISTRRPGIELASHRRSTSRLTRDAHTPSDYRAGIGIKVCSLRIGCKCPQKSVHLAALKGQVRDALDNLPVSRPFKVQALTPTVAAYHDRVLIFTERNSIGQLGAWLSDQVWCPFVVMIGHEFTEITSQNGTQLKPSAKSTQRRCLQETSPPAHILQNSFSIEETYNHRSMHTFRLRV